MTEKQPCDFCLSSGTVRLVTDDKYRTASAFACICPNATHRISIGSKTVTLAQWSGKYRTWHKGKAYIFPFAKEFGIAEETQQDWQGID